MYEALQKSTDKRRFDLSGSNAVAHRAGAYLALQARGAEGYVEVNVSFLTGSVGGRAEVLLDGRPAGEVDLSGPPDLPKTMHIVGSEEGSPKFRQVMVRSLTDAAVPVTGFEVGRYGEGVSYLSLGFPAPPFNCWRSSQRVI